jgi:hypothetical protein
MGERTTPAVGQTAPQLDADFIIADADYFHSRARRCYSLAGRTSDKSAAETLRSLGDAFEKKAETVADEG